MRYLTVLLCALGCAGLATTASADDATGRIYGRITTTDGDVYEGLIRWDRNEASWVDVLNGSKVIHRTDRERERGRRIEIFGFTVYEEDGDRTYSRTSGIRFGNIRSLERIGSDRARLILQTGEEVELINGSTDIGNDVREIIIEDAEAGQIELKWRDLELVELFEAPAGVTSSLGERLFGTVVSRDGLEFTGFVCWDVDEVLTEDILDGNDEDGRRRKIPFGNIERIRRNSSSSALVRLNNGDEFVLRGTNDVNSSNSGILVLDPELGQVELDWDEFEEVIFTTPDAAPDYASFARIAPLSGTVFTRDGDRFEGRLRWDDDESATWEFLDGELSDMQFDIEFGKIRSIERLSSREAEVTLLDGRRFELRGSNDVDSDNDGIFIIDDAGDEVRLSWQDFERVVFDKP
ncbi:MAG: hypothetical protein R2834_00345 [Rhodothermales bacterium]